MRKKEIRINLSGNSWYIPPTYASILSLGYRINNGDINSIEILDLLENGIVLKENDTLELVDIWYKTNSTHYNRDQYIKISGVIHEKGKSETYDEYSSQMGYMEISSSYGEFPWTLYWPDIKPTSYSLSVFLSRIDSTSDEELEIRTILDVLDIPIIIE